MENENKGPCFRRGRNMLELLWGKLSEREIKIAENIVKKARYSSIGDDASIKEITKEETRGENEN